MKESEEIINSNGEEKRGDNEKRKKESGVMSMKTSM